MVDIKKSILTEALTDYKEIMEAADQNAKNKLAKELPEKFNQLLNEELKSKNKLAKEFDKDNTKKNKESVETDETNLNDESDMTNQVKETEKVAKKSVDKKTLKEEFETPETLGNLDEFMTLDEIEAEIANFHKPEGEETFAPEGDEVPAIDGEPEAEEAEETPDEEMYEKLVQLRDELNSAIEAFGEEKGLGDTTGEETTDDIEIPSDEEINELVNQTDNEEIEEAHGLSYSARRNATGRHLPNADHLSKGELDQAPMRFQESEKKVKSLINENKNLTKQLNEAKAKTNEINETVNKFKVAVNKYRQQLTEMAVFNTNIAHVNNILVNESLALTQEDKLRVINEFKSVATITESQNKYKSILSEMTSSKKNITESVEEKITTVIEASSKHKLDEVIEKTAYKNNEHIDKIKKLINYVERRKNI